MNKGEFHWEELLGYKRTAVAAGASSVVNWMAWRLRKNSSLEVAYEGVGRDAGDLLNMQLEVEHDRSKGSRNEAGVDLFLASCFLSEDPTITAGFLQRMGKTTAKVVVFGDRASLRGFQKNCGINLESAGVGLLDISEIPSR